MFVAVVSVTSVQLFSTPWTVAHQAPLSMGFPRQEYWSGLPFPSPGDLPDPGIKLVFHVLAGGFFTTEPAGMPINMYMYIYRNLCLHMKTSGLKIS